MKLASRNRFTPTTLSAILALALLASCGPSGSGPGAGPGEGPGGEPTDRPTRPVRDEPTKARVVISGFYVAPVLKGGPEESISLENVSDEPVDIADWSLSDVLGPSSGKHYVERGQGLRRDVAFPKGTEATILQPGQEITVARDAHWFYTQFGFYPDFEMSEDDEFPENDPNVPDVIAVASSKARRAKTLWPSWPAGGSDMIVLFRAPDAFGSTEVEDVVVWDFKRKHKDPLLQLELREYERMVGLPEEELWEGPSLNPWGELASPYGNKSRVTIRNRTAQGKIQPETNSYRDWDCASSLKHLGECETHRVMMAGQSTFLPKVHKERAIFHMTSAPDSNYEGLRRMWSAAKKEIRVSVYYMKGLQLMDVLIDAIHRGVDVYVYYEGTTVGVKNGFTDTERYIAKRIEEEGRERSGEPTHGRGEVYWLRTDPKKKIADRYMFDHSKYTIVDGRWIAIGSENYGTTGHPVDPTTGNRGWEIQIETPEGQEPLEIVKDLMRVWDDDVDPKNHPDVIRYSDAPDTLDDEGRGRYGPPPRDYVEADHRGHKTNGGYVPPFDGPVTVEADATLEMVLSPDNSLNETTGIIAAINAAQEELLVQHLDLRLYWGSRVRSVPRTPRTTPSLLLEAIIAAARRGVRVRVLTDCSIFDCNKVPEERDPARDNNDDTVAYLRELAVREGLDLEARLIDIDSTDDDPREDREDAGFSKIHNKGIVVDQKTALFSSINGSENSFKGNREVAVLVTAEPVAKHYAYLFYYDWTTIAAPRGLQGAPAEIPGGECSADGKRTGILIKGLPPNTEHYFRVSAFDTDATDCCPIEPDRCFGPHESALSEEVMVRSSRRGTVGLSWEANISESKEGDLGGYRVYFGLTSSKAAAHAEDAERLKLLQGVSTKLGKSPIQTPGGCR